MAGEVKTTTTTGAGLMERRQASLIASLMAQSTLLDAVWSLESSGASSAQFPSFPAPVATITAATEADAPVAATAITIAAKTASLSAFVFRTLASKLYLGGGEDAADAVDGYIAQSVVASVDSHIASVITEANFTTTPLVDVTTAAALLQAIGALRNTGYRGTPYFLCAESQATKIISDAGAKFIPNTNEELVRTGKVGSLYGVQFRTLPASWLPDTTTNGKNTGFIYFKEFALGFAYRAAQFGGFVDRTVIEAHNNLDIAGTAYCKAVALSATGGIICEDSE